MDALLEAALARLRDIMSRLSIYSVTKRVIITLDSLEHPSLFFRETEFDEVSAYQQLLDFETVRVSQPERKHRATVKTSTYRRSASTSAYASGYSQSSKGRVSYG